MAIVNSPYPGPSLSMENPPDMQVDTEPIVCRFPGHHYRWKTPEKCKRVQTAKDAPPRRIPCRSRQPDTTTGGHTPEDVRNILTSGSPHMRRPRSRQSTSTTRHHYTNIARRTSNDMTSPNRIRPEPNTREDNMHTWTNKHEHVDPTQPRRELFRISVMTGRSQRARHNSGGPPSD